MDMKIIRISFVVVISIIIVGLLFNPIIIGLGSLFAHGSPNEIITRYPVLLQETFLRNGNEYVSFVHIPACAKNGIISVEDKRFYSDNGIDPLAVLRVIGMSVVNDHEDHGGSTLTQQLARLIISEPRYSRNSYFATVSFLRVMYYTLIVNHDFSKKKVLELYLNSVYFGKGAQGIVAASRAYFHTNLNKLTVGQCIYLTGLPQAPSVFAKDPGGPIAIDRYRHVLNTMVRNGYISSSYANKLSKERLFSIVSQ